MVTKKKKLTAKQKQFIIEYAVDKNATQSAIRAGYSKKTAYSSGQRLLKNVEIKKLIDKKLDKQMEKAEINGERVVKELVHNVKVAKQLEKIKRKVKIHIEDEETGEVTTEFVYVEEFLEYDIQGSNNALDKLAKHFGIYEPKKIEMTGKDGEPLFKTINIVLDEGDNKSVK